MARRFVHTSSNCGYNTSTPLTGPPVAMCAWFNPYSVVSVDTMFLGLSNTGDLGDYFGIYATDGLPDLTPRVRAMSRAGGANNYASSTTTLTTDTWYHAAGIFVSSTDRRAFTNGGGKGTNSGSSSPSSISRVNVGAMHHWTSYQGYMRGSLCMVAAWDLSVWPGSTNTEKADNWELRALPALARGCRPDTFPLGLRLDYWLNGDFSPEPDYHPRSQGSTAYPLTLNGSFIAKYPHAPVQPYSRRFWPASLPDEILTGGTNYDVSLSFGATGSAIQSAVADAVAFLAEAGSGDQTSTAQKAVISDLSFAGSSDFAANTTVTTPVTLSFAGSGQVTQTATADATGVLSFAGSGQVTQNASRDLLAFLTIDGASTFLVTSFQDFDCSLNFTGSANQELTAMADASTALSFGAAATPVFQTSGDQSVDLAFAAAGTDLHAARAAAVAELAFSGQGTAAQASSVNAVATLVEAATATVQKTASLATFTSLLVTSVGTFTIDWQGRLVWLPFMMQSGISEHSYE